MIFDSTRNPEGFFSEPHRRSETGAALRLQPKKNAGRFEDRRFPLPVSSEEKIKARRQLDAQRFEAAKISKLKFGEHGRDGALRRPQASTALAALPRTPQRGVPTYKLISWSLLVICAGTRLAW